MTDCDACSEAADPSFYVELEYPVRGEDEDEPGRVTGQLCARCAESAARDPPVSKLIAASDDAPNPSAGRDRLDRAADGLAHVLLAVEAVDYNALMEADLADLMAAYATVRGLTQNYRPGSGGGDA